jgi:hypothetical protein
MVGRVQDLAPVAVCRNTPAHISEVPEAHNEIAQCDMGEPSVDKEAYYGLPRPQCQKKLCS